MRSRDRLIAGAIRVLAGLLQCVPACVALAIGRVLGELVAVAQVHHTSRVAQHHVWLFGGRARSPRRFHRAVYRHLALLVIEFLRMPLLTPGNVRGRIDLTELDAALAGLGSVGESQPLICTAGHVGNWEWAGTAAALLGLPLQAVARPLDNPALDAWVTARREASGMRTFAKWNVLWSLKKALDRGAMIGINADQHARENARWVRFGHRDAATSATIAQLHLITGAPILVGSVMRETERGGYRFRVYDVIHREGVERGEDEQDRVLERINDALVAAITEYPAQWLWTHRRWRERG